MDTVDANSRQKLLEVKQFEGICNLNCGYVFWFNKVGKQGSGIKYLKINLTKDGECFSTENLKTLMKVTEEDANKWKKYPMFTDWKY